MRKGRESINVCRNENNTTQIFVEESRSPNPGGITATVTKRCRSCGWILASTVLIRRRF